MKKLEVCRLLGISLRTLERRMSAGEIKFKRSGEGQYATVEFDPNDLQLAAPEQVEAMPVPQSDVPVEAVAPPEDVPAEMPEAEFLASLKLWSGEELEAMRQEWLKPACPGGPVTNEPHDTSSNMPSPKNYARVLAVNSILQKRYLIGRKPIYLKREPYRVQVDQHCRDHNAMVAGVGAPEQFEYLWKGKTL